MLPDCRLVLYAMLSILSELVEGNNETLRVQMEK